MKIAFFCMVLASAFVFAACEEKAPVPAADAATNAAKAPAAPATPATPAAAATNAAK